MNEKNTQIVQDFLQFQGERNLSRLMPLFADQVDWYIPGDIAKASWLGRRNTKHEIEEFFIQLWSQTESVSATIDQMMTENDTTLISGEFSTKMLPSGKTVDSLFFIQLTIQDELIVKYRLLEDSFAVSRSLLDTSG